MGWDWAVIRMFRSAQDRLDYGEILRPPAGFVCEIVVGTTYSLDLETMLGVPLALFFREEMDENLLGNPIAILEGLRKSADKIALFCEGGQIQVPRTNPVFALLEDSVFEVVLKNQKSFHPKVWLIKYVDSNSEKLLYRFITLSRNLTFDRSWDAAVVLEGEVSEEVTDKNRPLIDFLRFLQARTTAADKEKRIRALAEELPRVHFQTHDQHFIDFSFLPLGIGKGYNKESTGLFKKYHHLLVISPFLSRTTVLELDRLSLTNSHKTLITRRSEIPHLTQEMLDSFPCYCLKDTVVDGEEAISESESAMADIQKQDIHAKLYFKTKYTEHDLYIGSANCSLSAWNGNVEFMLRLRYKKWGFRISQVIDELFGRDKEDFDERHNPFERIVEMPEPNHDEDDVQQLLQNAIKSLCRSGPRANVTENNGLYAVTIRFDLQKVDTEIDMTIELLGGGSAAKIQNTTVLSGLSLLELGEFYIVTAELGEESLQRILKIPTRGIPAERDAEVFKTIIKDEDTFLRYVVFLLSDDYLLALLEQQTERGKTGSSSWSFSGYDRPVLYENMLKAAARSPEKLREIDEIIQLLDDTDIVPPEFDRLYTTFLQASRRLKS
jgi:hypothetical protein